MYLQSVDNELVLWEPKMKEQSPGEVRMNISKLTNMFRIFRSACLNSVLNDLFAIDGMIA